jgi:hypothetical protein
MLKLLAIVAAGTVVVGCTATGDNAHTRLTPHEAIRLAVAEARKAGVDFTRLFPARAKYNAKEHWWLISWDERPPQTIGGDFGAVVDDWSGEVSLIPGR